MDEDLRVVVEGLVSEMPKRAGINGAQVEWFFRRIGAWSADDWFQVSAAIAKPGVIVRAGEAFEAAQVEGERSGRGPAMREWGGTAYTAAKMFCTLHSTVMIEGVGMAARLIAKPSATQAQMADVIQHGYDALRGTVQSAAVALSYRPLIRPELFIAMWAPYEVPLRLIAAENAAR